MGPFQHIYNSIYLEAAKRLNILPEGIKYIEVSQCLYTRFEPNDLLSADGNFSAPITLVQFDCPSADTSSAVWETMCGKMREQKIEAFVP